jgi:hypothetical protein
LDEDPPEAPAGLLDRGKIKKLVGALRSIKSDSPEVMEKIRTEADIEAGCKTVVAFRLKRSGMFWTVREPL